MAVLLGFRLQRMEIVAKNVTLYLAVMMIALLSDDYKELVQDLSQLVKT